MHEVIRRDGAFYDGAGKGPLCLEDLMADLRSGRCFRVTDLPGERDCTLEMLLDVVSVALTGEEAVPAPTCDSSRAGGKRPREQQG
ncbi:hypothetical protein [Streptomyces iconiensis]|uniref:Uncharacterized protein n=1 Tax=Streptomyces iconiensis TaxID=1384038 RepID=A0ABT6ZN58_9ACTN|nr:hypothetical protein [Streptomyces iconiensis]MDJ1130484.1 hypothetical protein [Streptomyces iconiensis]